MVAWCSFIINNVKSRFTRQVQLNSQGSRDTQMGQHGIHENSLKTQCAK